MTLPKRTRTKTIAQQRREAVEQPVEQESKYEGDESRVISTGSTLLDLAISGRRIKGGGIPAGILVEVFGPSGTGKTSLLCEIAGDVQRKGGEAKFMDPEARLDKAFAAIFGANLDPEQVEHPNTPLDVFPPIRAWKPKKPEKVNGIFVDSTAALASDLEMEDKTDEYSRRAKLFSQECRKTCRTITQNNYLVVFSNQIRQKIGAQPFSEQFSVPGGEAIPFYSSLRLRIKGKSNIKAEATYNGVKHENIIGIRNNIVVYKSSVWKPYREAPVTIIFDYGIDDVRENLQFIKTNKKHSQYMVGDVKVGQGLVQAIANVEEDRLERRLKREVIDLWNEIEEQFVTVRAPKRRFVRA